MSETTCPCCNTAMTLHGDVARGHLYYCNHCYGMLTSDQWSNTNINPTTLRNIRSSVFNGSPAGYRCSTCEGEMVKGPVSVADGTSIEVDGCLKCGSLWFDNREIEPFVPDFETVTPAHRAHTPIERTASAVAAALGSLVNKLNPSKHLEDGDDPEERH